MSLAAGTQLGPYEVVGPIGAGGMGEVYKARDTRLNRTVAIKILPSDFSNDVDRRVRFQREARTIAGLTHPHICTLHDVGEYLSISSAHAMLYLVMEHLEGQTLAERLESGPLSIEEVLTIGAEVADALAAAHRQGIIHRDLKPANVMLTKTGAKLLDFGLSKMIGAAEQAAIAEVSSAATRSAALTAEGTFVGTLQYMAPEQIEGAACDSRADIFSLGVLLYEMTTGRKPFGGSTPAGIIAAVLGQEPEPVSVRAPAASAVFDHLVSTCLAKSPDARWDSAADIRRQLLWLRGVQHERGGTTARPTSHRMVRVAAIAVGILGAAAAGWWFGRSKPAREATESPPLRFEIATNDEGIEVLSPPAISPDGKHVVFAGRRADQGRRLWLRTLSASSARALDGTDGAEDAFWSPDSRVIGFFADDKLKRVPADGGPALTICDARQGFGGAWAEDGTIVFTPGYFHSIYTVHASGGTPAVLTRLDQSAGEQAHVSATILPNHRRYLFIAAKANTRDNVLYAGEFGSSARQELLKDVTGVRYAQGYLLYTRSGVLLAQPFDADRSRLTGEPFAVADPVEESELSSASFSVSSDGSLVYRRRPTASDARFEWRARDGSLLNRPSIVGPYFDPALAHDGRRVLLQRRLDRFNQLWLLDTSRSTVTLASSSASFHILPAWSPDDRRIAFSSDRRGVYDLYVQTMESTDNSGELLYQSPKLKYVSDWSPDGTILLFVQQEEGPTGFDIWSVDLKAPHNARPVVQGPGADTFAKFSPDGRWIAYMSDKSGQKEVYVQPFPSTSVQLIVSAAGGTQPEWGVSSRELFYISLSGDLMSVSLTPRDGTMVPGVPKRLFGGLEHNRPWARTYQPTRSADRFLLIEDIATAGSNPPISVVTNWRKLAER